MRTLEEIEQDLLEIRHAGEAVQWTVAVLCAEACEYVSAKQVAADIGMSAGQVSRLIKTLKAFPDPASRSDLPGITFSHHRLAAYTTDPAYWLAQAEAEAWSTRDLEDALQQARATDPQAEAARQWAAALQRVRKGLEAVTGDDQRARVLDVLAVVEPYRSVVHHG